MIKITFIETDGTEHVVEANADNSVMNAAVDHGVPGILADCGGDCTCATCHVYISDDWVTRVGLPHPMEDALLTGRSDRQENSRLSCQIQINQSLNGLVLYLPEEQL